MVSKASEDLPDPETPVTTVRVLWGTSKSTSFRLWTRALRTTMLSVDIGLSERGSRVARRGAPRGSPAAAANFFYYRGKLGRERAARRFNQAAKRAAWKRVS